MRCSASGSRSERLTVAHMAAVAQNLSPSHIVRSRKGSAFVVPNSPNALTAKRRASASRTPFDLERASAAETRSAESSSGFMPPPSIARKASCLSQGCSSRSMPVSFVRMSRSCAICSGERANAVEMQNAECRTQNARIAFFIVVLFIPLQLITCHIPAARECGGQSPVALRLGRSRRRRGRRGTGAPCARHSGP